MSTDKPPYYLFLAGTQIEYTATYSVPQKEDKLYMSDQPSVKPHWRMLAIKASDYDFIYAHAQQLGLTGNNAVADALTALLQGFRSAAAEPSGELVELVERERSDSVQP